MSQSIGWRHALKDFYYWLLIGLTRKSLNLNHYFGDQRRDLRIGMAHTIVLMQIGKPDTRTYSDFESVNEAMEGIYPSDRHLAHPITLTTHPIVWQLICTSYSVPIQAFAISMNRTWRRKTQTCPQSLTTSHSCLTSSTAWLTSAA